MSINKSKKKIKANLKYNIQYYLNYNQQILNLDNYFFNLVYNQIKANKNKVPKLEINL